MGHLYNSAVFKIPFVNGAYVALSDLSSAPNCTGTDTAICTVANLPSGGIKAVAVDPSGNLLWSRFRLRLGVNAIYECNAACQTGGTATLVYSDVNSVSQIAFDPWGNLFFTDGIYGGTNFANVETIQFKPERTGVYGGTGFAANAGYSCRPSPTPLPAAMTISWMVSPSLQPAPSTTPTRTMESLPIPNTQTGGPDVAHQYIVSALGAKGMEVDPNGNEWVVVYHSGGDNLGEALLGDLTTPNAQYMARR